MSGGTVRSRTAALETMARGLISLESQATRGLAEFDTAARSAVDEAHQLVARRQRDLEEAEAALRAAEEEERAACQARVNVAAGRLAEGRTLLTTIQDERERFLGVRARYEHSMTHDVSRGKSELRRLGVELDRYSAGGSAGGGLAAGMGPAGGGSGSPAGSGGGLDPLAGALASHGLQMVDVGGIDLSGEDMANDHGRSATDYRWLVEKWESVIAPGIEDGMTRDDFAARDAQSQAPEGRRLADAYDVMLGSHAAKVSVGSDGAVTADGGRHRIAAAQQLGVTSIPARVHRSS